MFASESSPSSHSRAHRAGSPEACRIAQILQALPRIRFHDLRHTWATLALADGIHPKIVSERLGHSSVAITLDIYSHVTATLHADAAQQIANLVLPTEDNRTQEQAANLGHLDGTSGQLSQ